jgi:hypothetical protein
MTDMQSIRDAATTKPEPEWLPRWGRVGIKTLAALLGLTVGLLAFFLLRAHVGSGDAFDVLKELLPTVATQSGIGFALGISYIVLICSLIVVLIGTMVYTKDLWKMHRAMPDRRSAGWVTAAAALNFCVVPLVMGGGEYWLLHSREPFSGPPLPAQAVMDAFDFHDELVAAIFVAFLTIDVLTLCGIWSAKRQVTGPVQKSSSGELSLVLDQILYVDIPVLIGMGSIMLLVHDSVLTRDDTRFFVAGVATGFLAAHVLMSQVVFAALNVKHACGEAYSDWKNQQRLEAAGAGVQAQDQEQPLPL